MNISNYSSYFHDGCVFNVEQRMDSVLFYMASAEMDEEDLKDDIALSDDDQIHGILHLEEIKEVIVDGNLFRGILTKPRESSCILDFEWGRGSIALVIEWHDYSTDSNKLFQDILIRANKIWWENIPNLWDEYE